MLFELKKLTRVELDCGVGLDWLMAVWLSPVPERQELVNRKMIEVKGWLEEGFKERRREVEVVVRSLVEI